MKGNYINALVELFGIFTVLIGLGINKIILIIIGSIIFAIGTYNFFKEGIYNPIKNLKTEITQLRNRLDLIDRMNNLEKRVDKIENKKNSK